MPIFRGAPKKMEGNFSDESIRKVPPMGKGSSFDGRGFNKNLALSDIFRKWYKIFDLKNYSKIDANLNRLMGARRMKVLHRWKVLRYDSRMARIFEDEELSGLSEEIFGKII